MNAADHALRIAQKPIRRADGGPAPLSPPSAPQSQAGQSQALMPDFENLISQASAPSAAAQPSAGPLVLPGTQPSQGKQQNLMPDFENLVSQAAPSTPSPAPPVNQSPTVRGALGRISTAALHAGEQAFGNQPIGVSPQTT